MWLPPPPPRRKLQIPQKTWHTGNFVKWTLSHPTYCPWQHRHLPAGVISPPIAGGHLLPLTKGPWEVKDRWLRGPWTVAAGRSRRCRAYPHWGEGVLPGGPGTPQRQGPQWGVHLRWGDEGPHHLKGELKARRGRWLQGCPERLPVHDRNVSSGQPEVSPPLSQSAPDPGSTRLPGSARLADRTKGFLRAAAVG